MNGPNTYYRRHLPHYQPEGETYHVVFRLAGSIPASVLEELRFQKDLEEKRRLKIENGHERDRLAREYHREYFKRYEQLLDGHLRGPFWLRKPEIAEIVAGSIKSLDKKKYDLIAFSIMPNHVHMVFELVRRFSEPTPNGRDGVPSNTAALRRASDPTTGNSGSVVSHRVTDIVGSIKKYTSLRANRVLGRRGAFWRSESYDHVIRDSAELDRTIEYVLMNPVRAGLCNDWREWKWSYVKEAYLAD